MGVNNRELLISFLVANCVIILLFSYASNLEISEITPVYSSRALVKSENYDAFSSKSEGITEGDDVDSDVFSKVAEDGYTVRSDVYQTNTDPKTIFDADLIYKTTKEIHDKLYTKSVNQTCEKQFPACILLGVYKCGTRELMDFISLHPNIQIKKNPYEFGFFMSSKYGNGGPSNLKWFRDQLPCVYDDQKTMMKHAGYFADPKVPERLYKFNKNIKLVLMVREPVQRFISHVWFRYKTLSIGAINKMIERTLNVKTKITTTLNGTNKDNTGNASITGSGIKPRVSKPEPRIVASNPVIKTLLKFSVYDKSLARFLKYFTKEQLLVIESDEFKHNPASVLNKIETFLNLPRHIHEDMFVYNTEKKYYCLKSLSGNQVCYSDTRGRSYKKEINNVTKQRLAEYFRPHNERFFSLLGKRFDNWD